MLDHVSITVSDIAAAEPFYDSIMKVLGVVKVGRREDWLGYGERVRPAYPERVYISIRKGPKPDEGSGRHWCFKAKGADPGRRVLGRRDRSRRQR
jgi:catechol 2,3-dioxygenase-like lactoylglutathione lyase family enzyme